MSTPPVLPSVPWWCLQCNLEFPTEDLRDQHVNSRHPFISKDNPCQLCDKRYSCPKELQLHQAICHSPEKIAGLLSKNRKFHKCHLCTEVFSGDHGKEDLLTHLSRVHDDCQFKCSTCKKEFLCEATLKNHLTTHKFDLKCGQCGKVYYSKKAFDRHVAVKHEKSKAFICDLCGQSLTTRNSLKNHQRDRHGLFEKKWKCEVEGCGKRLKDFPAFTAHMAKHSKSPEFKCSFCGKGY